MTIKDFKLVENQIHKNNEKTTIKRVFMYDSFKIDVSYTHWPAVLGNIPEIRINCACMKFGPRIEFLRNEFANNNFMIVDYQLGVERVEEYSKNMLLGKEIMLFLDGNCSDLIKEEI